MSENMEKIETLGDKVSGIVAKLVAPDAGDLSALLAGMESRQANGLDPSQGESGFDWRAFALYFAQKHPVSTLMAPGAAVLYLYLIFHLIGG